MTELEHAKELTADFHSAYPNKPVLYPAPPFPGGIAGIQVDSHLIPSKNKGNFQTQIFICSRSFQVIPGGIRVKSE